MRSIVIAGSIMFCGLILTACQTTGPEPLRTVASIPQKVDFQDNSSSFETANESQEKVRAIIANGLKPNLARFDVAGISELLAEDFEFLTLISNEEYAVESRNKFLTARRNWSPGDSPRRIVHYAIKDMQSDPSERLVGVTAYVTYQSRHFSPRFMETMLFENVAGNWLLKRQLVVPLFPELTNVSNVQIHLLGACLSSHDRAG